MIDRLLNDKQVAAKLSLGVSTIWRDLREGKLPRPVKYGTMTRWKESDIDKFIERLPYAEDLAA